MGVDKNYGSGASRSAANSASRKRSAAAAIRNRKAAGFAKQNALSVAKNTPLNKQTKSQWNLMLNAQNNSPLAKEKRRLSTSILRNTTGFNKADGVDAGDLAGLAITIPGGVAEGFLRGAGRIARLAIPKSSRISSAAGRVVSRSRSTARALESQGSDLISSARAADAEAQRLRSTEYVGADYFDSSSRQVDPLFDKWETTSYRRGSGPSAESQAQARAAATGRSVRAQATQDYAGRAVRYRLDPTASELEASRRLESEYVDRVSRAGSLQSRATAASSRTTDAAAAEIRRRLASLRKAKEARK